MFALHAIFKMLSEHDGITANGTGAAARYRRFESRILSHATCYVQNWKEHNYISPDFNYANNAKVYNSGENYVLIHETKDCITFFPPVLAILVHPFIAMWSQNFPLYLDDMSTQSRRLSSCSHQIHVSRIHEL